MAVWAQLNARELDSHSFTPTAFDPHFVESISCDDRGWHTFIVMRGGKIYVTEEKFNMVLLAVSSAKDHIATGNMAVYEVGEDTVTVSKTLYKTIDKPYEQS